MNLAFKGVIMAVYLFVLIVAYIVLSSPFASIMADFNNLNLTNSDTEVESGTTAGQLVFDMVFAALGLVPLLWFIVSCFYREPDWRYRQ